VSAPPVPCHFAQFPANESFQQPIHQCTATLFDPKPLTLPLAQTHTRTRTHRQHWRKSAACYDDNCLPQRRDFLNSKPASSRMGRNFSLTRKYLFQRHDGLPAILWVKLSLLVCEHPCSYTHTYIVEPESIYHASTSLLQQAQPPATPPIF